MRKVIVIYKAAAEVVGTWRRISIRWCAAGDDEERNGDRVSDPLQSPKIFALSSAKMTFALNYCCAFSCTFLIQWERGYSIAKTRITFEGGRWPGTGISFSSRGRITKRSARKYHRLHGGGRRCSEIHWHSPEENNNNNLMYANDRPCTAGRVKDLPWEFAATQPAAVKV